MKKSLLLGIIGLASGVAVSHGQGFIALDNYNSSANPLVTYGANVFANGISGSFGTVGAGVTGAGWTVGLYFAPGNVTGSSDPTSGNGIPLGLALGTGGAAAGATTTFLSGSFIGEFAAANNFQATAQANGSTTVTVEVVAYNGASYANATLRGHSAAFTIPTLPGTSFPNDVGDFMSTFSVTPVPEPTTLALAGLGGLASLVMLRRKKA